MTLGLKAGRFYRNARLHCLNLLLTYDDGCLGRCAYCGLSGARSTPEVDKNFIRVDWPTHSMDEVVRRLQPAPNEIERVCISMVTRKRALDDVKTVARAIRGASDLPISMLVAPTLIPQGDDGKEYAAFKEAGAGRIGIAVDAATPELFEVCRGAGVGGPHRWDRYWRSVEAALEVFGEGMVGIHLIVGLSETEREMVETIQRARDLGARTHLFSFFPEKGSALAQGFQPPVDRYRRVQLARFLVDAGKTTARDMSFDASGRITGFGVDDAALDEAVASGLPFRTSGCPGTSGDIAACNRPYANCLPGGEIRNFPFQPDEDDVALVREQLRS
jgi:biotin synthase